MNSWHCIDQGLTRSSVSFDSRIIFLSNDTKFVYIQLLFGVLWKQNPILFFHCKTAAPRGLISKYIWSPQNYEAFVILDFGFKAYPQWKTNRHSFYSVNRKKQVPKIFLKINWFLIFNWIKTKNKLFSDYLFLDPHLWCHSCDRIQLYTEPSLYFSFPNSPSLSLTTGCPVSGKLWPLKPQGKASLSYCWMQARVTGVLP